MKAKVNRRTVDLSGYPDLIVIYLGMRVNALTGLKTPLGFGLKIAQSVEVQPDGCLSKTWYFRYFHNSIPSR
ncbi:MAG: hypothetical protein ACREXW_07085 [Gammaproteobacteria bacterium]